MKTFLFEMNHPAHFHLFKNTINSLLEKDYKIIIAVKKKDVLLDLVKDINQKIIIVNRKNTLKKRGILANISWLIQNDFFLYKTCREYKPDLLIGCNFATTHIGKLLKIPSITFAEDDWFITKELSKIGHKFCSHLISPITCDMTPFKQKIIQYEGFHKLSYLHPKVFTPYSSKIKFEGRFFLIRLSAFNAYHDHEVKGFDKELLNEIIKLLEPLGKIILSTEVGLDIGYKKYKYKINPKEMHDYLANADFFIGDSQSMAVESAMLGVPNIRFNDFVGKIGVLNEIENNWKLSKGIHSSNPQELLDTIKDYIKNDFYKNKFEKNRVKMLNEKINVSAFMTWFIENYPESVNQYKTDDNILERFK